MATEEDIRIFERLFVDEKSAKKRRKMATIVAEMCDFTEARPTYNEKLELIRKAEAQRISQAMAVIVMLPIKTCEVIPGPITYIDAIKGVTTVPADWQYDSCTDTWNPPPKPKELTIEEIKAKNAERSAKA